MASITVTITPAQAAQLDGVVAQGRFASAEEALAYSIDLLVQKVSAPNDLSPDQGALLARRLEQLDLTEESHFVSRKK